MYIKRLVHLRSERGFSHLIVPLVIVVLVGVVGTVTILRINADPLTPAALSKVCTGHPTLYEGNTGVCVKYLQASLNAANPTNFGNGNYKYLPYRLTLDGDFGGQTESDVITVQGWAHITKDGIVGPQTWSAILKYDCSGLPCPVGYSPTPNLKS